MYLPRHHLQQYQDVLLPLAMHWPCQFFMGYRLEFRFNKEVAVRSLISLCLIWHKTRYIQLSWKLSTGTLFLLVVYLVSSHIVVPEHHGRLFCARQSHALRVANSDLRRWRNLSHLLVTDLCKLSVESCPSGIRSKVQIMSWIWNWWVFSFWNRSEFLKGKQECSDKNLEDEVQCKGRSNQSYWPLLFLNVLAIKYRLMPGFWSVVDIPE